MIFREKSHWLAMRRSFDLLREKKLFFSIFICEKSLSWVKRLDLLGYDQKNSSFSTELFIFREKIHLSSRNNLWLQLGNWNKNPSICWENLYWYFARRSIDLLTKIYRLFEKRSIDFLRENPLLFWNAIHLSSRRRSNYSKTKIHWSSGRISKNLPL